MTAQEKAEELHQHHEELVEGLSKQLKGILDSSEQAVYLYLDDRHKACNTKFARLLGYKTAKEWSETDVNFVDTFLAKESQDKVVSIYHDRLTEKLAATSAKIAFIRKDGQKIKTNIIQVPILYDGHLFALHFVTEV